MTEHFRRLIAGGVGEGGYSRRPLSMMDVFCNVRMKLFCGSFASCVTTPPEAVVHVFGGEVYISLSLKVE